MEELVSFPLSREEPASGHNFLNFYGKVRNAASSLYQSVQPQDQSPAPSPQVEPQPSSSAAPPLIINRAHKSRPSVGVVDMDDFGAINPPSDPVPTPSAPDYSDVESMFSTASYSLSKAYLSSQYLHGRKRALNSLGREFWMKDENAKSCFRCLKGFTTFRRRHHCRVCGQIFCSGCTKLISGAKFQGSQRSTARLRCCLNCLSTLSSQHSSSDEDELPSFFDEIEREPRTGDRERLASEHSHRRSMSMPPPQDEFYSSPRQRTPSFSASPLAEEGFMRSRSNTRSSARSIVLPQRLESLPLPASAGSPFPQSQSQSQGQGQLNQQSSQGQLTQNTGLLQTPNFLPPQRAIFPRQESAALNSASLQHLQIFLERVLSDSELDLEQWRQFLKDALLHIADTVRVESIKERGDPKDWVKLKRIPGGQPCDIDCLSGTVFTHNFALKNMPAVDNPRLLLISFPLEYARGGYMSLTPVLAQEKEYLRKLVRRIEQLRPTVLLSSSHVSGVALQLLAAAGIVVATGIRDSALERLARYTNTEALNSLDRLSNGPALGACGRLEVRTYREANVAKSFLFFTGLPTTGCTVLLRGRPHETSLVKAVMEIMVDVSLSLQMETHLMRDQIVVVPESDKVTVDEILSSSPFVEYGQPYLLELSAALEDEYVQASDELRRLEKEIEGELEEPSDAPSPTAEEPSPEAHSTPPPPPPPPPPPLPGLPALPPHQLVQIRRVLAANRKKNLFRKWTEAKQQWEQDEAANPFMQNPCSHQTLNYTFFLYCNQTDVSCVGPETCSAEFYLASDIPLGQYVEGVVNTFDDGCPDGCPNPMGGHRRCYFHGSGVVTVKVGRQLCPIAGLQDTILMWNHCTKCDSSSAYMPMSSNTWRYSFGKYLELSFWGQPLPVKGPCQHNIYRDYVRLFAWHDTTLEIAYGPIELFEVDVPCLELRQPVQKLVEYRIAQYETMQTRIRAFWRSLKDTLSKIQLEGLDDEKHAEATRKLEAMTATAERDRRECLEYLDEVYDALEPTDFLGLNAALRFAQSMVSRYHQEFNNFDGLFFPSEKDIRRVTVQQLRGLLEGEKKSESESERGERGERKPTPSPSATRSPSLAAEPASELPFAGAVAGPSASTTSIATAANTAASAASAARQLSPSVAPVRSPTSLAPSPSLTPMKSVLGTKINLNVAELKEQLPPRSQKVSFLAKHFEELSHEFELERQREHRRLMDRQQASIIADTQPVATVFKDVSEAVNDPLEDEDEDDDELDAGAYADNEASDDDGEGDNTEDGSRYDDSTEDEREPAPAPPPNERKSLIQSLVNFWAERSSTRWSGIEYLLGPKEHLFSDSLVIIREDELSSLIAFCLSLPDYSERIAQLYSEDDATLEDVLNSQRSVHLKYNFANASTTMSCKTFFSQQFDALRRQCGCADTFVQSLSRCNQWEQTGGKSGSLFLKTADDRYILKSISQSEFDSWSSFAPSYFNYMGQALFHDLPTALAKIFGVYQIHIRASTSNVRLYVVVSENLFIDGSFTRFFDLKGSMRNRKAAETGRANQVLLDENMLDYIYENPVYVREHSKRRLRASIYNDTLFLTKMNVMDYSLVIGIDENNNTIVSGIIDYIRTFTWDKKVESWVKGRAAGGALEPTVISPKQYKVRFRESMEHYFLLVPDCWHLAGPQ